MKKIVTFFICSLFTIMLFMNTNCFAAWWGTPGYEWALSKNLTSIKTQAQLNREVTLSDYYSIILKYLKMKNIEPSATPRTVQGFYNEGIYNGTIEGLVNELNSKVGESVTSITPQQYRIIAELVDHAHTAINDYSEHLYRDDLKNLDIYLDLVKYRAASLLIENDRIHREYKSNILYSLRNTKYVDTLKYGIMPMCGSDITRGSFLVLMHNLLSGTNTSSEAIWNAFEDSGVLIGYYDGLWLKKCIRYSELYTFLYRFEAYDFGGASSTQEG